MLRARSCSSAVQGRRGIFKPFCLSEKGTVRVALVCRRETRLERLARRIQSTELIMRALIQIKPPVPRLERHLNNCVCPLAPRSEVARRMDASTGPAASKKEKPRIANRASSDSNQEIVLLQSACDGLECAGQGRADRLRSG